MVPDIFGIQGFKQSSQVADRIAAAVPGLGVAHPDPWVPGQGPWPMAEFPPKDKDKFGAFIAAHPYEGVVKQVIQQAFEALEAKAAAAAGAGAEPQQQPPKPRFTMGFCWGALMACEANADSSMRVSATAGAHPTFFGREKEIAAKLRGPLLLLPTKGDPGEVVVEAAKAAGLPFADKCRVVPFDGQVHGFMAARGDYKDETVREAAGKGAGEVAAFFAGLI
jgi:dienelactone hydrolase